MMPLVVGYIGRFDNNKGASALYRVIQGTNWWLILGGKGAPHPPPEMDSATRDRIRVYPHEIEFVGDWYTALDVYVLNSASEGFPLSVIEALHCGCRIATSDVSDLRSVFGDTLSYFERDNIEQMREAILRAPDAAEGQRIIAERLSVERMIDQYEEALGE